MKIILTSVVCIVSQQVYSQGPRIAGGVDVEPKFNYPFMVMLTRYGEYWCGGTLLKDNLAITAAHCMGGAIGPLINFKAQLHRHNLSLSLEQEHGLEFNLIKRWVAPGYDADMLYNDLAVVELDSPTNHRTTIVIDTKLIRHEGFRAIAIGWGATGDQQSHHNILQQVELPLTSRQKCKDVYMRVGNYTILPSQICAGFRKGGRDSCQGDSGGPLFTYFEYKPLLIGVISNGFSCAKPNIPGIYTRVAAFHGWIETIINGTLSPTPDQDYFPIPTYSIK